MWKVCYGIIGKTKMHVSESCICEDADALTDELAYARESQPEEDYRISPLYTKRRTNQSLEHDARGKR